MSWSNITFNKNKPDVHMTLNTNQLQINTQTLTNPGGTCTFCSDSNEGDWCNFDDCTVPFNQCDSKYPVQIQPANNTTAILGTVISTGNCCEGSGGLCHATWNQCQYKDIIQTCANIDSNKTCTLGRYGIGECYSSSNNSTCAPGTDWNIPDVTKSPVGWINCYYNFDYTNYTNDNNPGLVQLTQWLTDIYNGVSPSAPTGMDSVAKNRIRDANIVYSLIYDYYNSIYDSGPYNIITNVNSFLTYDIFSQLDYYKNNLLNKLIGSVNSLYPDGAFPNKLQQNILDILIPPTVSQSGDTYTVTLQLSYSLFQEFNNVSDKAGYFSNCIGQMLRDQQGTLTNLNSNNQTNPSNPQFDIPIVGTISAISLVDSYGNPSYGLQTGITLIDWNSNSQYDNYIFGTISLSANVTKWSPMLIAYFYNNNTITYSKNACNKIGSDSNMIPINCLTSLDPSKESDIIKNDITEYCIMQYIPPSYTTRAVTDKIILNNNFPDCRCYTSTIAPVSDRTPGNPGAMCFDTYCSNKMLELFDLSGNNCMQYCDQVWEWINNTGSNQSQNAEEMDWQRYASMCGNVRKPYTPANYNTSVAITGIIISILSGLLMFSFSKHKNYTGTKTSVFVFITMSVILGITFFFSRDMAGLSMCGGYNDKTFMCKSRITNINLPSSFCNYVLNCECDFDINCPNGCICISSSCVPSSGTRKMKTIKTRNPNYSMIIVSILCFILFSFGLIYLYEDYHWPIRKSFFITIVLILGIIPLLYYTYDGIRKKSKQVFAGQCLGAGLCIDNSDCDNQTCSFGQCVTYDKNCPILNNSTIPTLNSLFTGFCIISFNYNNTTYYLSSAGDNSPLTLINTITPSLKWYYDSVNKKLTGNDSKNSNDYIIIPKDLCKNVSCSGVVYTQLNTYGTLPEYHYIITTDQPAVIYCIEANAYLIPDISKPCQTQPCPQGNCGNTIYVTYTTDYYQAQVWDIQTTNQ